MIFAEISPLHHAAESHDSLLHYAGGIHISLMHSAAGVKRKIQGKISPMHDAIGDNLLAA
jgi:hypothetical protein